jgi:hypothetical protein
LVVRFIAVMCGYMSLFGSIFVVLSTYSCFFFFWYIYCSLWSIKMKSKNLREWRIWELKICRWIWILGLLFGIEFLDLTLFDLKSIKKQSFGARFWFWGCSFKKEFLYNHNSQLFVFILYYIRVSLLLKLVFDFTLMKGYGVGMKLHSKPNFQFFFIFIYNRPFFLLNN